MTKKVHLATIGIIAFFLLALAYVLTRQSASIGVFENIQGIPYPVTASGVQVIVEPIAHADVFVHTVFAKELEVVLSFIPYDSKRLALGVRQDSFWLSYSPQVFYTAALDSAQTTTLHEATIKVPITDKIVDSSGTIDMMIFSGTDSLELLSKNVEASRVKWELHSIGVKTKYVRPQFTQLRDFVRGIIMRERPL